MQKLTAAALAVYLTFIPVQVSFASDEVSVSARSAILATADGDVLYEKNADETLPMASTTKIMTCLLAAELCDPDEAVSVDPRAVGVEGSSLYMKRGDTSTVKDLIYAAMLRSANDAAAALAYHISGDIPAFAELMNGRAAELGMDHTNFANPHGLQDDAHYTTARDYSRLAVAATKNVLLSEVAATKEYVVTLNGHDKRPVKNHNRLLFSYDGATGLKTGYTKSSGRCLVSSAERDGVKLVCVTLNDPDDWRDHKALLDLGFDTVCFTELVSPGDIVKEFALFGEGKITASNRESLSAVIKKAAAISYTVIGDRFPAPPINKGDLLATVKVYADGKSVGALELTADIDVPLPKEDSFIDRLRSLFFK